MDQAHIEPGSTAYMGALASYIGLDADYVHKSIVHENVRTRPHERYGELLVPGEALHRRTLRQR